MMTHSTPVPLYLFVLAERPQLGLVLADGAQVRGGFGGTQAALGGRPVDGLAVVLELHVLRPLEPGLVQLNQGQGVLQTHHPALPPLSSPVNIHEDIP